MSLCPTHLQDEFLQRQSKHLGGGEGGQRVEGDAGGKTVAHPRANAPGAPRALTGVGLGGGGGGGVGG